MASATGVIVAIIVVGKSIVKSPAAFPTFYTICSVCAALVNDAPIWLFVPRLPSSVCVLFGKWHIQIRFRLIAFCLLCSAYRILLFCVRCAGMWIRSVATITLRFYRRVCNTNQEISIYRRWQCLRTFQLVCNEISSFSECIRADKAESILSIWVIQNYSARPAVCIIINNIPFSLTHIIHN